VSRNAGERGARFHALPPPVCCPYFAPAHRFDAVSVKGGTCEYYKGCPEHAQVAFCHFPNIAHNWSGGPAGLYGNPDGESASALAWEFWQKYAW
jgi:poly(3-hydroxybutyrate) depolymerase